MAKPFYMYAKEVSPSAAVLTPYVDAFQDDLYAVYDLVADEQMAHGYWEAEETSSHTVVFVGFPRNFKSRTDCGRPLPVSTGGKVAVSYEQPLGESVPYEEMGLSRFL